MLVSLSFCWFTGLQLVIFCNVECCQKLLWWTGLFHQFPLSVRYHPQVHPSSSHHAQCELEHCAQSCVRARCRDRTLELLIRVAVEELALNSRHVILSSKRDNHTISYMGIRWTKNILFVQQWSFLVNHSLSAAYH